MNLKNKIYVGVVTTTLISSVALWEGDKRTSYEDIAGVLTVCSGYTGKDIVKNKVYTEQECVTLLRKELDKHGREILQCINVPLKQHQYDAFTMFAYNVGSNAFCTSKSVLKPLNEGHTELACTGLLKWVYANGKYVQGLANRRNFEYKMCMGYLNPPSYNSIPVRNTPLSSP